MLLSLVKFLGILLGVFLRTWLPARRKALKAKKQGSTFQWRRAYIKTAGASFAVALVGSFLVFPSFTSSALDLLSCLAAAFTAGFGSNAVTNEIYALIFSPDDAKEVQAV